MGLTVEVDLNKNENDNILNLINQAAVIKNLYQSGEWSKPIEHDDFSFDIEPLPNEQGRTKFTLIGKEPSFRGTLTGTYNRISLSKFNNTTLTGNKSYPINHEELRKTLLLNNYSLTEQEHLKICEHLKIKHDSVLSFITEKTNRFIEITIKPNDKFIFRNNQTLEELELKGTYCYNGELKLYIDNGFEILSLERLVERSVLNGFIIKTINIIDYVEPDNTGDVLQGFVLRNTLKTEPEELVLHGFVAWQTIDLTLTPYVNYIGGFTKEI